MDANENEFPRSKRWINKAGDAQGGVPLVRGVLYQMLRNRIYVGEIIHKEAIYPGQHPAIVDRATFEAAQALLDQSVRRRQPGKARPPHRGAPLTGLIYDSAGHLMSPVSAPRKGGATYRYYVSSVAQRGRPDEAGVHKRVPAPVIETMVREVVAPLLSNAAETSVHRISACSIRAEASTPRRSLASRASSGSKIGLGGS